MRSEHQSRRLLPEVSLMVPEVFSEVVAVDIGEFASPLGQVGPPGDLSA